MQKSARDTFTDRGRGTTEGRHQHLAALSILLFFILTLFFRILFTDRVLASGDILTYFYPYRDYAASVLGQGRIPLWNPYIFSGAPFLANPQAAVLYPFHWPLIWLPVTKQIYWSAATHTWILGAGGYALMRRWGHTWSASLITGLSLAGSGFYGGLLGHINQMNAAAWLPWMVWALENKRGQAIRLPASRISLFSLLIAFSLLAGHTQTAYINLFGVGLWLVVGQVWGEKGIEQWRTWYRGRRAPGPEGSPSFLSLVYPLLSRLSIYFVSILMALLIAAAQLLPTIELNELGLRSGGLSYWDATSFSLHPLKMHWTLLPSYGIANLRVVFQNLGYTEFVAYVGLLPLALAGIGLWKRRGNRAWLFAILMAGTGLFLALGRWNPIYYLLFKLVPGFDLFRTPARWMMLYTLGMTVLAGIGSQAVLAQPGSSGRVRMGTQSRPERKTALFPALLILLLTSELLLAARALPHTHPTAPQAVYAVRTAPAHLLTEPGRIPHPAAMGRFLSLSALTFDPGDMADWRRIYRQSGTPQIDDAAFLELVIALKSQEILAPNLPLLWRIPAVDGFDGGVLPLQRYNQFISLLIPGQKLVPDGRIREQLDTVPPADLMGLMDARFVITDKVRDLWFQGIYYDRQVGGTLQAGAQDSQDSGCGVEELFPAPVLDRSAQGNACLLVEAPHPFEATAVGVVGFVTTRVQGDLANANRTVAEIEVIVGGESRISLPLTAGGQPGADFADRVLDSQMGQRAGATVVYRDTEARSQEYLAWLKLDEPMIPEALLFRATDQVDVTIQAVTLIDERTRTFQALLPSDQGAYRLVHSGDVKLYQILDPPGRAYLADQVVAVDSPRQALSTLQAAEGLRGLAVVELPEEAWQGETLEARRGGGEVTWIDYTSDRIVLRTTSAQAGLLVLADAYYPGWQATVDGKPAPIFPTNLLFRSVPLPAGEHEIVFSFRPRSWQIGLRLSMLGGGLWLLLTGIAWWWRRPGVGTEPQ